jgi:hypothetical protein
MNAWTATIDKAKHADPINSSDVKQRPGNITGETGQWNCEIF